MDSTKEGHIKLLKIHEQRDGLDFGDEKLVDAYNGNGVSSPTKFLG